AGYGLHTTPPRPRRRLQPAPGHQRRGFELLPRARAQAVGLERPRDFELAEVGGVDLIERRIARVTQITAVDTPLSVGSARLSDHGHGRANDHARDKHSGTPQGVPYAEYGCLPALYAEHGCLPG